MNSVVAGVFFVARVVVKISAPPNEIRWWRNRVCNWSVVVKIIAPPSETHWYLHISNWTDRSIGIPSRTLRSSVQRFSVSFQSLAKYTKQLEQKFAEFAKFSRREFFVVPMSATKRSCVDTNELVSVGAGRFRRRLKKEFFQFGIRFLVW